MAVAGIFRAALKVISDYHCRPLIDECPSWLPWDIIAMHLPAKSITLSRLLTIKFDFLHMQAMAGSVGFHG
jgi:hypothetical protein